MPPPYPASQIGVLFRRDERELSEKYGQFAAPFFMIEISDQSGTILFSSESHAVDGNYDLDGLIVSDMEWEENDCQADMMSFTVINVDMRLHDNRLFAEGNFVDLWMGYDGKQPEYMGRGIIVTIEPDFTRDAVSTIRITCYDISHFMMEEGKAEIQSEGTRWFERNSVPVEGDGNPPEPIEDNARSDTDEQLRETQRTAGPNVGLIPSPSVDSSAPSTDIANEPIIPLAPPPSTESTAQPQNRTVIRQMRIPSQRRNRGKVWRNLRDDEIAAEIFRSYGITSFSDIIDQRASGRTITSTVEETITEDDSHRDTAEQRDADQAALTAAGGPTSGVIPQAFVDQGPQHVGALDEIVVRATGVTIEREITRQVDGRRVVQKAGTSDWNFLKQLAKNHGYIVFVFFYYETKNWIGYWGPPNQVPQHTTYTFNYNNGDDTTLGSFKPKLSMRGQKTEIDLLYTDPILRRQQRLRVSMENVSQYSPEFRGPDASSQITEPIGNGPEVVLTIHGQRVSVSADRQFRSIEEARRWLMAFWYQHASEFCEAEGDCIIGIPEIRCRHRHMINGFGRYDGNYFFTKVSHRMGGKSTYTTEFSVFRMGEMLDVLPDQEGNSTSVESNDMGQITPEARDVINRWQEALGRR